jgi:hypothetical protein
MLAALSAILPSCGAGPEPEERARAAPRTSLDAALTPLAEWFRRNDGRPRAVALLSPT